MRALIVILVLLTMALIAESVFDSAVAAWIALAALLGLVVGKKLSWVGLWPADWPDILEGGD